MRRQTRRQSQRRCYTDFHVYQLAVGVDFFGDGFGYLDSKLPPGPERDAEFAEQEKAIEAKMREAWPLLRNQAFADARRYNPIRRPWAWWKFESPSPRDESMDEYTQLDHMGLLSETEKAAYAKWSKPDAGGEDYPDE